MTPVNRDESADGRPISNAMTPKSQRTRSIGRKRRALGWILLASGLLIAAIWTYSGWRSFKLDLNTTSFVTIGYGSIGYMYDRDLLRERSRPTGFVQLPAGGPPRPVYQWWFPIRSIGDRKIFFQVRSFGVGELRNVGDTVRVDLLLWPASLAACAAGITLLRSSILARRRALSNKCKSCNYDLTGLAAGTACPECGKGATTTALAPADSNTTTRIRF